MYKRDRTKIYSAMLVRDFFLLNWIFIAVALLTSLTMASSTAAEEKPEASITARGCCEFSSDFHKTIAHETEENIVNSPLSAHLVLSYLFHGSDTHTAKEIKAGLHLSDTKKLHSDYKDLMQILNGMDSVELSLANAIFLQADVTLHKTFQTKGEDFYNFTVQNVNFDDNVGSAEKINSWVSKSTNDKINSVISPDDINEFMKVVLVNAVYFKGQWQHQFNAQTTEKRVFHLSKSSNKQVPTMYKEFKYAHGEITSLNSRFLEIPYTGGKIDMIIVLPNDIEGLKYVEENFDWNAVVNAERKYRSTQLYLPKFKIESTIDLKKVLFELGFTSMFGDTADFSAMCDVPLKIDSATQKAFIEVNELGTEAAAATTVRMMMKRSLHITEDPDVFIVDRPFLVAVRHIKDNTPLFLSSVRDISVTPEKDEL